MFKILSLKFHLFYLNLLFIDIKISIGWRIFHSITKEAEDFKAL